MKEITLVNGKHKTQVDDEDFEFLSKHKWYHSDGHVKLINSIPLTHLLMECPQGMVLDHRDRNGFNNQRLNIRIATKSQNQANRKIQSNNTSGYRGVTWSTRQQMWQAQIKVNGKMRYLGFFKDVHEAARRYNKAALHHFGEFAALNVIPK